MQEQDQCSSTSGRTQTQTQVMELVGRINFKVWRLILDTPRIRATTPMLRGVWGRALRFLDEGAYQEVFVGSGITYRHLPKYIIRPAPPNSLTAPAIDWILINVDPALEPLLWRAWHVAGGMGLGSKREPFRIKKHVQIAPIRSESEMNSAPDLSWPYGQRPTQTPCSLQFSTPLRVLRKGKLLDTLTLADITTAGVRRIAGFAGLGRGAKYRDLVGSVRIAADRTPSGPWRGERSDLVRWSATQKREIELYGVTGSLVLPYGPGEMWPLLTALRWLHVGKGTVFGMGQLDLVDLMPNSAN